MHARVTTVRGNPAGVDAGIENFKQNVQPFAREHGRGSVLLVDRETGDALVVSFWEDEASMRASEEAANALRAQAAGQMQVSEDPGVARYEVAVYDL
jgi:heme-degrading monooxygenase HmoA